MESIERGETIHRQFDWSQILPSRAVVTAIASIENVEPFDLSERRDFTLFDYIDPDALDDLVSAGGPIEISFTLDEFLIRIDGNRLCVAY